LYLFAPYFSQSFRKVLIQARIILDTRSTAKAGHPIKIYLSGYGKKAYISTGYFSRAEHWKDGPTRRHPNYNFLRGWIARREARLQQQVNHCNAHRFSFAQSRDFIKQGPEDREAEIAALEQRLESLRGDSAPTLYEFWDRYTSELAAAGKSVRAFEETLAQLKHFKADVALRDVNYEWLQDFIQRKYATGCGPSGASFYLRTIRRVYLEAQRRPSLQIPAGNPFAGLIPASRRREPPRITREQLAGLLDYQPRPGTTKANAKRMTERMAVFCFQVYIGGHDLVDVARLSWEDVAGGRVRLYRYKNRSRGGELVDNLLIDQAIEILKKHGRKDRGRPFHFIPDPESEPEGYRTWRGNYNRALRVVSEDLNITPAITSKAPRYIFRTWAGECGADILATMQIQGHRARGMTFSYQGRLPDRIVDRVLREVIAGE